jgi:hypothetical protein
MLCSQTPSVDVLLWGTATLSVLCNMYNCFDNKVKMCVIVQTTAWHQYNFKQALNNLRVVISTISYFSFSLRWYTFYILSLRVSPCSDVPRVAEVPSRRVLRFHGVNQGPRLTRRTVLQRHKLHTSRSTRHKVSVCLFRVQECVCPKLVCLSLSIIMF